LATSRACPFSAHERDDDKEEDPFVFSVFFVVQLKSVTNFDLHSGHRKGVGEEVVEVVEVADARRCFSRLVAVVVVPPLSNLLLREGKTAASSKQRSGKSSIVRF